MEENHLELTRETRRPPEPTGWGSPASNKRFDLTATADKARDTLTVTAGTTWESGVDLELKELGLKAKLGTKLIYEHEVEYEYELPGGHCYLAARYARFPTYLWTVETSP